MEEEEEEGKEEEEEGGGGMDGISDCPIFVYQGTMTLCYYRDS